MPEFRLKVIDPDGRQRTARVAAAGYEAAVEQAERKGYIVYGPDTIAEAPEPKRRRIPTIAVIALAASVTLTVAVVALIAVAGDAYQGITDTARPTHAWTHPTHFEAATLGDWRGASEAERADAARLVASAYIRLTNYPVDGPQDHRDFTAHVYNAISERAKNPTFDDGVTLLDLSEKLLAPLTVGELEAIDGNLKRVRDRAQQKIADAIRTHRFAGRVVVMMGPDKVIIAVNTPLYIEEDISFDEWRPAAKAMLQHAVLAGPDAATLNGDPKGSTTHDYELTLRTSKGSDRAHVSSFDLRDWHAY